MYRSGESEYLINGAPATLRDITDILRHWGPSSARASSSSVLSLTAELRTTRRASRRRNRRRRERSAKAQRMSHLLNRLKVLWTKRAHDLWGGSPTQHHARGGRPQGSRRATQRLARQGGRRRHELAQYRLDEKTTTWRSTGRSLGQTSSPGRAAPQDRTSSGAWTPTCACSRRRARNGSRASPCVMSSPPWSGSRRRASTPGRGGLEVEATAHAGAEGP